MAIKEKNGGLKDKKTSTEKGFTKRFRKNQEKLYPKTSISNHSSQNDTVILDKSSMAKDGNFSFFLNKWLFVKLRAWSRHIYRIVASRSTCYYSENEKFCFLKSRILSCRIFFLGTKLFCLLFIWAEIYSILLLWDFMDPHKISAHSDNFYFLTPHVTNWIKFN